MKKYIILSAAIIFSLNVFSQAPAIQWQKCLGGTGFEIANSMEQTSDGGYIVAGYSDSNDSIVTGNHGDNDYWVVKLSNAGYIQWQKCYGGTSTDEATSVKQSIDGGYIVAGWSSSNDSDVTGNHGDIDCWIIKLDSTGALQWQKSYGGTDWDDAESIQQTNDGGYIFSGFSGSTNGDVVGNHGGFDYWVVKLDGTGNIQWQKCYGGTNNEGAYSIQQTNDGGYIVAGSSASNDGDVAGNHGGGDYWIVKLDSTGTLQWQRCYGGTNDDEAFSIQQTTDGGYIVAGESNSNNIDVTGNHGSYDYWIVKLDSVGILQWQKTYGGINSDAALCIEQANDGGYIAGGASDSNDGDVTGHHGNVGLYQYDYWIVKLNSTGLLLWQESYGGTVTEAVKAIQQAFDGGYVALGSTSSSDGDVIGLHGGIDGWILKFTPEVGIEENNFLSSTTLSPNPFHETATLTINTNKFEDGTIEIKNILGAIVQPPKHFTGNKITLQRNNLPAGIYFYTITLKENIMLHGKSIVQ